MNNFHRDCLRKNYVYLSENLLLVPLYPYLVEHKVFPSVWIEQIQGERSDPERRQKLVTDLKKRGPDAWNKFLICLEESGQSHIAERLRRTAQGLPPQPPATETRPSDATQESTSSARPPTQETSPPDQVQRSPPEQPAPPEQPTAPLEEPRFPTQCTDSDLPEGAVGGEDPSLSYIPGTTLHRPEPSPPGDQPPNTNNSSNHGNPSNHGEQESESQRPHGSNRGRRDIESTSGILRLNINIPDGTTKREGYRMNSRPRGYVLILNNRHFHEDTQLDERIGTDIDCQNIEQLMLKLGFYTDVKQQLAGQAMWDAVCSFARYSGHRDVDSCVLVILTHGVNGGVYGIDGGIIQMEDIAREFDTPNLLGKPKFFVVQACRGGQYNHGQIRPDGPLLPSTIQNLLDRIPNRADMLFAYSTIPGHVSWRDEEHGTWFIQALCEVFSQHAHNEHVLDMLIMVNKVVSEKGEIYKQIPEPVPTLREKWYLNPPQDVLQLINPGL